MDNLIKPQETRKIQHGMARRLINFELARLWKEAEVA
jgi:hypothetical protein